VQTLATAVCIVGDTVTTAALLARKRGSALVPKTGSGGGGSGADRSLDDTPVTAEDLDRALLAYADMLSHWGLLSASVEVLKHCSQGAAVLSQRAVERYVPTYRHKRSIFHTTLRDTAAIPLPPQPPVALFSL
jgi:hypothetical protein